ncbi:hypothetical protein [Cellulomonas biazotea]|uniref:Uncharacterized protein n=1 Tax=Cellulomonas biazotea TaxID=1709 RepID=A0A402DSK0_9CELL|nr:hypothetical protein [Cellulomonas biazotea]GCE77094.1 hypothetical protein CBZ_21500 [Cellulomonas biazotea]
MPDSLIAVRDGGFRFDTHAVTHALSARWPRATFTAATGRLAALSAGQFDVNDGAAPFALVEVDIEGQSLGIDWTGPDILAAIVAVVTGVSGFPDDGSVVLSDWALDVVPLAPHMSQDEVTALRG